MDKNPIICYGSLYVVATPIGNLDDITYRAINILQSVNAILVEDTRHSKKLLAKFYIHKPLIALHAYNEHDKTIKLIEEMKAGKSYALISDAGTPLINDPGFTLVHAAQQNNIQVIPIPGACAIITALSAAGIPCDIFTFVGFLPAKKIARLKKLSSLRLYQHTIVLYESTHRILATLIDILEVYGNTYNLLLAKELTKTYEKFIHGTAEQIYTWLSADLDRCNGEFVIILPSNDTISTNNVIITDQKLLKILLKELPAKQAIKIATQLSTTTKNELYKLALSFKNNS